jgi:hypothetical protein
MRAWHRLCLASRFGSLSLSKGGLLRGLSRAERMLDESLDLQDRRPCVDGWNHLSEEAGHDVLMGPAKGSAFSLRTLRLCAS